MNHPNPAGNGCSLEDCYSNLFALTDICGIRWKKWSIEHTNSIDHLEDAILESYSRCIQKDILCVWRRVQKGSEPQHVVDQLAHQKELWVFWYGDEPSILQKLLAPDLQKAECEHGSWDKDRDNGLSYECRTLLFKALHNLIERCLISKGFARLGRWFVQPYDPSSIHLERSSHLSFSFNFFLHGESSVCASIEVKQHPPVWKLTANHLTAAQENQTNFQVILAPYGLSGNLTGNVYRETDQSARKILDEWARFYPLETRVEVELGKVPIPPLVEVIVAGVRMKYPSGYIFLCDMEDQSRISALGPHKAGSNLAAEFPGLFGAEKGMANSVLQPDINKEIEALAAHGSSQTIRSSALQDNCITVGQVKRSCDTVGDENCVGVWDFSDASTKTMCSCSRHRANKLKQNLAVRNQNTSAKHSKDCSEKMERQIPRAAGRPQSFHRREVPEDAGLLNQLDLQALQLPQTTCQPTTQTPSSTNSVSFNASSTPVAMSTTISGVGGATGVVGNHLPHLNTSSEGVSVESPSPAAPSPLEDPHSQANPQSAVDPTMPKLSPHPPVEDAGGEKDANVVAGLPPGVPASVANKIVTPLAKPTVSQPVEQAGKAVETQLTVVDITQQKPVSDSAPLVANGWTSAQPLENKSSNWIASQQKFTELALKRPCLSSKECEDDDIGMKSLYSFDQINNWSGFPVKKARYELVDSTQMSVSQDLQNINNLASPVQRKSSLSHAGPDVYKFSDETTAVSHMSSLRNFRQSNRLSSTKSESDFKENSLSNDAFAFPDTAASDISSPPATPTAMTTPSLTSSKDLVPKHSDLDHIFESDSDNEDTSTSPIVSTVMPAEFTSSLTTSVITEGSIGAPELSRMYPTPPSNPEPFHDPHLESSCSDLKPTIKHEPFSSSLPEDPTRDWSYVYKKPVTAKFEVSSKYLPVELPSASQPLSAGLLSLDVEYKASWQFQIPLIEKPHLNSYINIPSIENISSISSRVPPNAVEASPAPFNISSVGQQRTPMSFDLQSPASNASSYQNRTLNSVDPQGTNIQIPEAHSLVVNIALSDSRLNLYRDHNFDSCNICVCNMSIRGVDVGLYMPDVSGQPTEPERCTCGFSSVVNRKVGHKAGLFYEDEVDITGIRYDQDEERKPSLLSVENQKDSTKTSEDLSHDILEQMMNLFTVPYPSLFAADHINKQVVSHSTTWGGAGIDELQVQDGNDVSYQALDLGRQAMEHCPPVKLDDPVMKNTCLHKWQFLQGANRIPSNSQDSMRLLKSLQPILQDAIQNSRVTRLWEHTYRLSGPLTWKEFHQMAGRGSDENSAPQPIPTFLVGHDRDWLSVAPHAIHYWDKNLLEPVGKPRDIAYVVVAPENDYVVNATKLFFREMSFVYEMCKMGRHCPISKKLRDGIMRVGKNYADKVANEKVDEWFQQIGNNPIAEKLRLYAKVCNCFLSPYLAQQTLDKSLFEPLTNHRAGYKQPETNMTTVSSISVPPSAADHGTFSVPTLQPPQSASVSSISNSNNANNSSEDKENIHDGPNTKDLLGEEHEDDKNSPALVIYLVNPFTFGQEWDRQLERLVLVGFLKCYYQLVKSLPEHLQQNISLQIVPLKTILEVTEKGSNFQVLKSMSFSVFSMCRWNLNHTVMGRSLTGFGPAAAADRFLKKKDGIRTRLYNPPFILAPVKNKLAASKESGGDKTEKSIVIFCVYCLSEDQRWLLAVCTDEQGELMESCTINIEIPNRNRRRKASARKIGLQKLWDFLLGVVSMVAIPCRLVISRFGRIGHGELKGWAGLLSKKNLLQVSKNVKETCNYCNILGAHDVPGILSACLVSLEAQSTFHIMADAVKQEEKQSSNCPLQTPRDASVTHILVFPTSATAQANSNQQQIEHAIGAIDSSIYEFGIGAEGDADDLADVIRADFQNDSDLSILTLFQQLTEEDKNPNTGNISNPGSPVLLDHGMPGRLNSTGGINGPSSMGHNHQGNDPQDDPNLNLLQQPLAMGYYVSTAKCGPLPRWFWASCPEKEPLLPNCFKAALHIHTSQKQDEFMTTHGKNTHALDSSLTCDVLRYVLENFNSLSWLTYNTQINDRDSCLPVHFVVLMQMYQAFRAFV